VETKLAGTTLEVKGPKGRLEQAIDPDFDVKVEDGSITVSRPTDQKHHRARHGLYRALINNMVAGVSEGFSRKLEIEGTGYNAKADGKSRLVLNIGFCHPVTVNAEEGVEVETPTNTTIVVSGPDKQKVGQTAANIRRVRPPEPYKGKGIRYAGEYVRRKAGKAVGGK
jgi:large subunit ribosomal protein L6